MRVLDVVAADPTLEEAARLETMREDERQAHFEVVAVSSDRREASRERIARERSAWTAADQALSDALDDEDIAKDAQAHAFSEARDTFTITVRDGDARETIELPAPTHMPWVSPGERDGPKLRGSAFLVAQADRKADDSGFPEFIRRAYFKSVRRAAELEEQGLSPWDDDANLHRQPRDTLDELRDEPESPDELGLEFPAAPDGFASPVARDLSVLHAYLRYDVPVADATTWLPPENPRQLPLGTTYLPEAGHECRVEVRARPYRRPRAYHDRSVSTSRGDYEAFVPQNQVTPQEREALIAESEQLIRRDPEGPVERGHEDARYHFHPRWKQNATASRTARLRRKHRGKHARKRAIETTVARRRRLERTRLLRQTRDRLVYETTPVTLSEQDVAWTQAQQLSRGLRRAAEQLRRHEFSSKAEFAVVARYRAVQRQLAG